MGALSASILQPLGGRPGVDWDRRTRKHSGARTSRSPAKFIPTRLIRTFKPLKVPSHAWSIAAGGPTFRRESGSAHDFGKISRAPHRSVSSCRHSWNAWLVGTGMRTYTGVEYKYLLRRFEDSRYPGTLRATPNHHFAGLERSFGTLPHEGGG